MSLQPAVSISAECMNFTSRSDLPAAFSITASAFGPATWKLKLSTAVEMAS